MQGGFVMVRACRVMQTPSISNVCNFIRTTGNMNVVRASMLPKLGDSLEMDWGQLRLGYRLGMCAILTVWVCWDCVWGLVRDGKC